MLYYKYQWGAERQCIWEQTIPTSAKSIQIQFHRNRASRMKTLRATGTPQHGSVEIEEHSGHMPHRSCNSSRLPLSSGQPNLNTIFNSNVSDRDGLHPSMSLNRMSGRATPNQHHDRRWSQFSRRPIWTALLIATVIILLQSFGQDHRDIAQELLWSGTIADLMHIIYSSLYILCAGGSPKTHHGDEAGHYRSNNDFSALTFNVPLGPIRLIRLCWTCWCPLTRTARRITATAASAPSLNVALCPMWFIQLCLACGCTLTQTIHRVITEALADADAVASGRHRYCARSHRHGRGRVWNWFTILDKYIFVLRRQHRRSLALW